MNKTTIAKQVTATQFENSGGAVKAVKYATTGLQANTSKQLHILVNLDGKQSDVVALPVIYNESALEVGELLIKNPENSSSIFIDKEGNIKVQGNNITLITNENGTESLVLTANAIINDGTGAPCTILDTGNTKVKIKG